MSHIWKWIACLQTIGDFLIFWIWGFYGKEDLRPSACKVTSSSFQCVCVWNGCVRMRAFFDSFIEFYYIRSTGHHWRIVVCFVSFSLEFAAWTLNVSFSNSGSDKLKPDLIKYGTDFTPRLFFQLQRLQNCKPHDFFTSQHWLILYPTKMSCFPTCYLFRIHAGSVGGLKVVQMY